MPVAVKKVQNASYGQHRRRMLYDFSVISGTNHPRADIIRGGTLFNHVLFGMAERPRHHIHQGGIRQLRGS